MNVFISYAREDAISAERMYQDLLKIDEVTPWLDSKNLLPGVRWEMEVMSALKTCDLFIIILSSRSVNKSGFIQKELYEALEKLKTYPPDRIFVIPARLDDCHPKHPELNQLQWIDMFPEWSVSISKIEIVIRKLLNHPVETSTATENKTLEIINTQEAFLNRLKVRGEMKGCDAMELSFSDLNLQGKDLSGANFVRCRFNACTFQNCNLKGANFEGAKFRECSFSGADLWGVNFWGADLRGITDLDKAKFKLTNFYRTRHSSKIDGKLNESHLIHLGDYGAFVKYYSEEMKMGNDGVANTFLWLNHRYFRMMFGKNNSRIFSNRAYGLLNDLDLLKESIEDGDI